MADRLKRNLVAELVRNLREGGRPRLPEGSQILWRAFLDLSKARTYHFNGPNPISFTEIEAWTRLHRWPLQPRHIEIIRAMDEAYVESFHRNRKQTEGNETVMMPRSSRAVSSKLFDIMFG